MADQEARIASQRTLQDADRLPVPDTPESERRLVPYQEAGVPCNNSCEYPPRQRVPYPCKAVCYVKARALIKAPESAPGITLTYTTAPTADRDQQLLA